MCPSEGGRACERGPGPALPTCAAAAAAATRAAATAATPAHAGVAINALIAFASLFAKNKVIARIQFSDVAKVGYG